MKDKPLYSEKEGKRTLRGERNEVAVDERQTGSGKLRGDWKLQQTRTNQHAKLALETRGLAEKHQLTQMIGSWNPRGERIEIRVLKYKVQRTAYAATTPTVSTVFHSKQRCHANMATLDMPTYSTCSERLIFLALFHPKPNGCLCFDLESCNLMCTLYCCYPPMWHSTARPGSPHDALHLH